MTAAGGPSFEVRFDQLALAEDLEHASAAGRRAMERSRRDMERDGLAAKRLMRCQPEARDGTRLGGCVKTRVPWPSGQWGLVLVPVATATGQVALRALAFGERHPDRAVAPERLPGRPSAPARRLIEPGTARHPPDHLGLRRPPGRRSVIHIGRRPQILCRRRTRRAGLGRDERGRMRRWRPRRARRSRQPARRAARLLPRAFRALPEWAMAGRAPQLVDARIYDDVTWLQRRYHLRVTAAREAGHRTHGDGTAVDLVPADGTTQPVWDASAGALAQGLGWGDNRLRLTHAMVDRTDEGSLAATRRPAHQHRAERV